MIQQLLKVLDDVLKLLTQQQLGTTQGGDQGAGGGQPAGGAAGAPAGSGAKGAAGPSNAPGANGPDSGNGADSTASNPMAQLETVLKDMVKVLEQMQAQKAGGNQQPTPVQGA